MSLVLRCEICGICYPSERPPGRMEVLLCPECQESVERHAGKRRLLKTLRRIFLGAP